MNKMIKRLKDILFIFLKTITIGKKDEKRKERLSKVLRLVRQTLREDWTLGRNIKLVRKTIYSEINEGYDFISDGMCGGFYFPRYRIDPSKEPIKIYKTWAYFLSLDHDKGFMTFSSDDESMFYEGKIVGLVDSEAVIEEIARNKTDVDIELLGFFDDLRLHLDGKRNKRG